MRPLHLQIEGFTCFKERQQLDLSGLELFAITGPTGAGKSSLLDAMMLALYGEVPRVGDRYTELISHGRDRMAVMLDFRIGQRTFRVTRTRRRKGVGQAELEELVGGIHQPVADGVREVDQNIQRLLGMPYEAFTQAVVLPQGEFMKFLQSEPRKRREILRELLRLQVYERMRQAAAERSGAIGHNIEALEQRLREDYQEATTEALSALQTRAVEAGEIVRHLSSVLAMRRRELDGLKFRQAKTHELRAKRIQLQQLEGRKSEIEARESRVDAARRALPVIVAIRTAEDAERTAAEHGARLKDAEAALGEASRSHRRLQDELARAEDAAAELPVLRARIRELDEIKGVVQAREAVRSRLTRARSEQQRLTIEVETVKKTEPQVLRRLETLDRALEEARARMRRVGYDADFEAGLETVRKAATLLQALREQVTKLAVDEKTAAAKASKDEAAVGKYKQRVEEAKDRLERAKRAAEDADHALAEARQKSAAAVLRKGLKTGDPCPVCEQRVDTLPRHVRLQHLETLEEKLESAQEAHESAREELDDARDAAAQAQTTAKERRRAADELAKNLTLVRSRIAKDERELDLKIGTAVQGLPGETLEARVLNAVTRVNELRRLNQEAMAAVQQAGKNLEEGRREAERLSQRVQLLQAQLETATRQVEAAGTEVASADAEILRVTEAPDPLAEREQVSFREGELARALQAARENAQSAENQLARASERMEAMRQAMTDASRRATEARALSRSASSAAGFPDETSVAAALITPTEIERLTADAERYRFDLNAVERRVSELSEELHGDEVGDGEVESLERDIASREQTCEAVQRDATHLELQIRSMADRVKKAVDLARELRERRRDHRIYRQLADDLRTDRFQAFVLDETFRELASGGSIRLMTLSGRYTLEYRDDAFYVVDHDNAREQRSTDTLSGGETFLASLALALELSEQVQRAASAVPLDSLFIDEGFGTLDPETLDTVAAAVQSLPVGGRMVGIITHSQDLADGLPARVVVEKRTDGSRLTIDSN